MAEKKIVVSFEAQTSGFSKSMKTIQSSVKNVATGVQSTAGKMGNSFKNTGNTIKAGIGSGLDGVKTKAKGLGSSFKSFGDQAGRSIGETEGRASKLSGTLKGVAGVVVGAFAVDKVLGFGKSMVTASADAEAMDAQFEQVFGNLQGNAQKTVDGLGEQFGMAPNRIKPAMSQMTSMFKGLGMDTEDAMKTASDAVTLSADAAAFYDVSYEDANSSLNSFIKGNYEGGESIGLFANETQMAAWASKELGLDWDNLDEKGKQVARLKYAEFMQKSAGATGQAQRESGSLQNQLGNLKQVWTDLMAQIGKPVLNVAIKGLTWLQETIKKVDAEKISSAFKSVGGYLKDTFGPVITDVVTMIKGLWGAFTDSGGLGIAQGLLDGIKGTLNWFRENTSVITALLGGLTGAFLAFQVVNTINKGMALFNTLMLALKAPTIAQTLAQLGLNAAMLANPITWIIVAIGALIAIGILLWKNWDTIKAKAIELKDVVVAKVTEFKTAFVNKFNEIKAGAIAKFTELKTGAVTKFTELRTQVTTAVQNFKTAIVTKATELKTAFVTKITELRNGAVNKFNNLKTSIVTSAQNIKSNVVTKISELKTGFVNKVNELKDGAVTKFNNLKDRAGSIMETAKSKITSPIESAKNKISELVEKIKGFFTNLKLKIPTPSMPKLPHFSLKTGSKTILGKEISYPTGFDVSWYQSGGIFKGTQGGSIVGLGENGHDEAVLPLSNKSRMKPFAHAVASMMPQDKTSQASNVKEEYTIHVPITLDGREIAKGTFKYDKEELRKDEIRRNRRMGII